MANYIQAVHYPQSLDGMVSFDTSYVNTKKVIKSGKNWLDDA